MPYISSERRRGINEIELRADGIKWIPSNAGDLQYVIAEFIHNYISDKGLNYQHCNDMLGALSGAHSEFYRQVVAPYENQKIIENGDVYSQINEYPKPKAY